MYRSNVTSAREGLPVVSNGMLENWLPHFEHCGDENFFLAAEFEPWMRKVSGPCGAVKNLAPICHSYLSITTTSQRTAPPDGACSSSQSKSAAPAAHSAEWKYAWSDGRMGTGLPIACC